VVSTLSVYFGRESGTRSVAEVEVDVEVEDVVVVIKYVEGSRMD
jgi:hypothetical protein